MADRRLDEALIAVNLFRIAEQQLSSAETAEEVRSAVANCREAMVRIIAELDRDHAITQTYLISGGDAILPDGAGQHGTLAAFLYDTIDGLSDEAHSRESGEPRNFRFRDILLNHFAEQDSLAKGMGPTGKFDYSNPAGGRGTNLDVTYRRVLAIRLAYFGAGMDGARTPQQVFLDLAIRSRPTFFRWQSEYVPDDERQRSRRLGEAVANDEPLPEADLNDAKALRMLLEDDGLRREMLLERVGG